MKIHELECRCNNCLTDFVKIQYGNFPKAVECSFCGSHDIRRIVDDVLVSEAPKMDRNPLSFRSKFVKIMNPTVYYESI